MLTTTDNNCGKVITENENDLLNLQHIGNQKISDLVIDGVSNLLIFPTSFNECKDRLGTEYIYELKGNVLTTGNILGFIGVNNTELQIRSRFDKKDENYLLHYMLHKVFSINLFDLKHSSENENVFDFMLYLFPYYFKKALRQGLYKNYQRNNYNDANIRGPIDVSRHIRLNMPFEGKIAYSTREYAYDNHITQLIRHTIEYICQHKLGKSITCNDIEMQGYTSQIKGATKTYDRKYMTSILNQNIRPISHPYFSCYSELQKICVQILRYEGIKYGETKDKVYGLLFDGAWLWEEYLNTVLQRNDFLHPENKNKKGPVLHLFKDSKKYERYPDYYKEKIVLDAKYKRLDLKKTIDRNDMHQIISYLYILQAQKGGFIFPVEQKDGIPKECSGEPIGILNGYNASVSLFQFPIPEIANSFNSFCQQMEKHEHELLKEI